jgi:UDP-N-acetylmuramoyl-tripeptide--D-alanyl-D-alanine ligase
VLGDMLELGAAGEEMHRQVGRQVREWGFEVFVAIGAAMKSAADEAKQPAKRGGQKVVWFENTPAAREGILKVVRRGDRILLKGSHGMALETLLGTLRGVRG